MEETVPELNENEIQTRPIGKCFLEKDLLLVIAGQFPKTPEATNALVAQLILDQRETNKKLDRLIELQMIGNARLLK